MISEMLYDIHRGRKQRGRHHVKERVAGKWEESCTVLRPARTRYCCRLNQNFDFEPIASEQMPKSNRRLPCPVVLVVDLCSISGVWDKSHTRTNETAVPPSCSSLAAAYGKPNRGQGLSLFRPHNVRCVRLSWPTQRARRSILDDGKFVALIAMWTRRGSMIAQACQSWLGSGPSRRPRPTVGGDGEQVSVGDIRDKEAVRSAMDHDYVLGRSDRSR